MSVQSNNNDARIPILQYDDREKFLKVCQDLNQFGTQDHEIIVFRQEQYGAIPVTSKRNNKVINKLISGGEVSIVPYVLKFLEKNKNFLDGQEQMLRKLENITHKDETKEKERFFSLISYSLRLNFLKETEQQRKEEIEQQRKEEIAKIEQIKQTMLQEVEKSKQEIIKQKEEELHRLNCRIQEVSKKLVDLKTDVENLSDTLLICAKGVKLLTHFKLLEKIPFFVSFRSSGLKETVLSSDDREKFPKLAQSFDLSDYSYATIQLFLQYLEDPNLLSTIQDSVSLLELYRLADYFGRVEKEAGDTKFVSDCISALDKILSDRDMLELLSQDFRGWDPLMQKACERIATRFADMADDPAFLNITHESLIEFLKNESIHIQEEGALFQIVMRWLQNLSQRSNESLFTIFYKQINGVSLADLIQFEYIPKEIFQKARDLKILEPEYEKKLVDFYLFGKPLPTMRPPSSSFSRLRLTPINDHQAVVIWNISMDERMNLFNLNSVSKENFYKIKSEKFIFRDYVWTATIVRRVPEQCGEETLSFKVTCKQSGEKQIDAFSCVWNFGNNLKDSSSILFTNYFGNRNVSEMRQLCQSRIHSRTFLEQIKFDKPFHEFKITISLKK